jgi:hypothetical protein
MRIITTGTAPTEGLGLEFRIAQLCVRRSPGFGHLPQSGGANDSAESSASTTLPPEATQFLYPTGSLIENSSSVTPLQGGLCDEIAAQTGLCVQVWDNKRS